MLRIASFVLALLWTSIGIAADPIFEPIIVRRSPANEADVLRLPDGSLQIFYMVVGERVESICSVDGGRTWSQPRVEFPMDGKRSVHACSALIDADGEAHVFFLVRDVEHRESRGGRALDVWHNRTVNGRTEWGKAKRVFYGYVGAIRGAAQLESGRIVVPFAVRGGTEDPPRHQLGNTGTSFSTSIYSDDRGQAFRVSDSMLTAPVYSGYNGNNYGAIEPCITLRENGHAWLLLRTQTGKLYESYSPDGKLWSDARPTRFYSSNSPAASLRLDDNRLVVVWNNSQMPPRRENGRLLYAGRDTLHAAISDDDGKTWRGFREIYRDPTRHEDPPAQGDRGTAYPSIAQAEEGHLVVTTGQNEKHRCILLFHPDWLLETEASDDLSGGFENWSAFKEHGEGYRVFLPRRLGPQIRSRENATGGKVMHVRRPDENAPDCAVWNFPAAHKGSISLRLSLQKGAAGANLALTDRFYNPNDLAAEQEAMFVLPIDSQGRIGNVQLQFDQWHTVKIVFDTHRRRAMITIDDQPGYSLTMNNDTINGLSYLRIRSAADRVDTAGLLIDSVGARRE